MSLILVYFILLNGRTTEREGEDMRGREGGSDPKIIAAPIDKVDPS